MSSPKLARRRTIRGLVYQLLQSGVPYYVGLTRRGVGSRLQGHAYEAFSCFGTSAKHTVIRSQISKREDWPNLEYRIIGIWPMKYARAVEAKLILELPNLTNKVHPKLRHNSLTLDFTKQSSTPPQIVLEK